MRFISSKRGRTVEKIKGAIERNYRITDENRVQLLEGEFFFFFFFFFFFLALSKNKTKL